MTIIDPYLTHIPDTHIPDTHIPDPTPNLPLLRKILCHIDEHPKEWDQGVWSTPSICGTAYCVAGFACVFTGHTIHGASVPTVVDNRASVVSVSIVAQQELGLTALEADRLFAGSNDRRDVQKVAKRIARRAGEVL